MHLHEQGYGDCRKKEHCDPMSLRQKEWGNGGGGVMVSFVCFCVLILVLLFCVWLRHLHNP